MIRPAGMLLRQLLVAVALVAASATPAQPTGAIAVAPASPQEVLRRLEATHATVTAISGTYTQVRDDRATDDRIISVADFKMLKPNRFRADYRKPRATTILALDDLMYRYIPANKQVERYQFRRRATAQDLTFLLLGFGARVEDVLKVYEARPPRNLPTGVHGVTLVPKDAKSAGFRSLTIHVTPDDQALPVRFVVDQSKDVTITVEMDRASLNMQARLSESSFRPNFPRDAEVVDVQ
jgi:outer membrane lipoprotein-sorting protein